ncbi:radical SAM protein [Puteibacter caeruleilacunae]|nr:radical SAM protein [Puteibacter caeruleilacunae]
MREELLNINFEITNTCNQNCLYCYNKHNRGEFAGNPMRTLLRLFEIADIKQLTITGGEPTTSKHLLECVVHARLQGVKVVVITNASLVKKKLFKQLIKAGVSQFQVTVNSSVNAIHDKMVAINGALQNTLENISFIKKNGGEVIPSIILTTQNVGSLEDTVDLFQRLELRTIMVNRYNISKGDFSKELTLSTDRLRECFQRIDTLANVHDLTVTSNVCTPFCILNPKHYPNIQFGACPDDPKFKPITIDFSGDVRLCNHSPRVVGNIFRETFNEMLYSSYANSWVANIPTYCADCKEYDDCKGGCKAASEQIYNSNLIVDPILDYNAR